jgi:hypothetical protein
MSWYIFKSVTTPEIWRTIGRALPDWRERKEELSHRRAEMLWCAVDDEAEARSRVEM